MNNIAAVPTKKSKKKKKKKEPEDPNAPPKPKRKTGLNKPLILSPQLSALMDGDIELSRPEIVKRLWTYIKGNDLQDPKDRRFILCDDKLKSIFNCDRVNSFGMNRDLSKHLTKKDLPEPLEDDPNAAPPASATSTSSAATTSTAAAKQSPTVTAETPDDILTPKEGEHVAAAIAHTAIANPNSTSNTTSSTPTLH
ncbi:SWIB/MDM2 domain-containing protein [Gongronella butleri]|nr:SWIB/MDM2 domain-containing protein [Gongronella butleri]